MNAVRVSRFAFFIFSFLFAIGVAAAANQEQQRSDTSLAASGLLEAMRQITAKPYSFDRAGKVIGRTELDQKTYTDLAAALENLIANAAPSAVDSQVLDELTEQLRDPYAWENGSQLARALGHIGPRAIDALIEMLRMSSDQLIRERLSEILASAVYGSDKQQIDDRLVDNLGALLDDPDSYVVGYAASALGSLGSRAESALPALERSLKTAEEKGWSDVIGNAISAIRTESR